MSVKQNKAVIRNIVDLIDEGDLKGAFELYTTDVIAHYPGGEDVRGRDACRERMAMFLTAFRDFKHTFKDILAIEDKVVARFSISGTHKGELMGIAPTGKHITFTAIVIYSLVNDKMAESWAEYDALSLMQQLGAITLPK